MATLENQAEYLKKFTTKDSVDEKIVPIEKRLDIARQLLASSIGLLAVIT